MFMLNYHTKTVNDQANGLINLEQARLFIQGKKSTKA